MIWITITICIVSGAAFLMMSLGGSGVWKYRSAKRLFRICKRLGCEFPVWLTKDIVLRFWIGIICMSLVSSVMIFYMSFIGEEIKEIEKPAYGQGSVQEELEYTWTNEKDERMEEYIRIQIQEKNLTDEEIEQYMKDILERLPQIILAGNKTFENIQESLDLVTYIEGNPAEITWVSSNPELIGLDGSIGRNISEKGNEVCLTAYIQIQDTEEQYIQTVKVYPPVLSMKDQIEAWIEDSIHSTGSAVMLPEKWENIKLTWSRKQDQGYVGIVILLLSCPFFYIVKCYQDYRDRQQRRKEQLLMDYPAIINKLTLMLSAGLNVRNSIDRIVQDYLKNRCKRAAYEELIMVTKDMKNGISEKAAYERFGERCQLHVYRTLSALLVQYLQKGGDDIQRILEEECKRAQETRIQQVKVMGEKASTKLLFPMILMLIIVFIIILVPAWTSFS